MIRAQMKLLFKRKEFQVTFAGMMLLIAYVFYRSVIRLLERMQPIICRRISYLSAGQMHT